MRVWITRTRPDAEATAARVAALGHEPLVGPLLEAAALPADVALDGVAALAFTSRRGVAGFAALSLERGLPVFAVGESTAEAARAAGFRMVRSADGDAADLARLLTGADLKGAVLHPSAREPARDLAALAPEAGVRTVAVYETRPLDPPDWARAALAGEGPGLDAVLIHSPRAARRLAEVAPRSPGVNLWVAACISPAAAAPLAALPFAEVRVAARPDEAALLDLLGGGPHSRPA